jgi:hypothetical protein
VCDDFLDDILTASGDRASIVSVPVRS